MTELKVDLTMLRGMAGRYTEYAKSVAALDTTKATENLAQSLPNTNSGKFAVSVGKRVDAAFDVTSARINHMADVCREAADNYQRTDQALVAKLAREGVL